MRTGSLCGLWGVSDKLNDQSVVVRLRVRRMRKAAAIFPTPASSHSLMLSPCSASLSCSYWGRGNSSVVVAAIFYVACAPVRRARSGSGRPTRDAGVDDVGDRGIETRDQSAPMRYQAVNHLPLRLDPEPARSMPRRRADRQAVVPSAFARAGATGCGGGLGDGHFGAPVTGGRERGAALATLCCLLSNGRA